MTEVRCNRLITVRAETPWAQETKRCDHVAFDYEDDEVHAAEEHWERGAQAEKAGEFVMLRNFISERLNPRDDDVAEIAILLSALDNAVAYVEAQTCVCPPDPDDGPCLRCDVLGRDRDKSVDR